MLKFKELDPLLHSEQRLAIISLLAGVESANFVFIREQINATAGTLSVHIKKLSEAGYILVTKGFKNNMPETMCKITDKGLSALDDYVEALKSYLPKL